MKVVLADRWREKTMNLAGEDDGHRLARCGVEAISDLALVRTSIGESTDVLS